MARKTGLHIILADADLALLPAPMHTGNKSKGGGRTAFIREAIREKAAREAKKSSGKTCG